MRVSPYCFTPIDRSIVDLVASDPELITKCPKCGANGLTRSVRVKGNRRTVTYECDSCHGKWSLTAMNHQNDSSVNSPDS